MWMERRRLSVEHKINTLSQNAICLHENDLETVGSVQVNQGVLTAHWNPLYLIRGGEDEMGGVVGRKGGHLVANVQRQKCDSWTISSKDTVSCLYIWCWFLFLLSSSPELLFKKYSRFRMKIKNFQLRPQIATVQPYWNADSFENKTRIMNISPLDIIFSLIKNSW